MRAPSARRRRAVATACAVGAAIVLSPAAATAAVPGIEDGRWYYEATGLSELHQRTTGEGVTVAVLDGRVNTAVAELAGADVQPHEPSYCAAEEGGTAYPATTTEPDGEHATSIATMLVGQDAGIGGEPGIPGVAPGVTLRTYAIYVDGSPCETPADQESLQSDALLDAVADGADIIAVPGNNKFAASAVAEALRAGVIIVAAGGNDGVLTAFPASYNGVLAVGTVTPDATLAEGSPYGDKLGAVAPGALIRELLPTWDSYARTTGSSNATAYTAGALALLWSLNPGATGNQIMQAMIHTTDGVVAEEPAHDPQWGYGTVNVRTLLSVDPASYPDENPFLRDDGDPTKAEVLGTTAGDPSDPPAEEPQTSEDVGTAQPEDAEASGLPTAALVGGLVALIVIAGVVVAIVISRRRAARTDVHDAAPPTYARGNHG